MRWLAPLVPVAVLVAGAMVWHTTAAVFSGGTQNAGNAFATGSVSLDDDDGGVAPFSVSGMQRSDTGSRCIAVSYTGSLNAAVKLYAASVTGQLAPYLDLTIEQGTGGGFSSCAGFAPSATLFSGTLQAFGAAATSHASGIGSWSPTAPGQSRTFRVTYTLSPSAPASVQHGVAGAQLTWEARSS
ncbi:MAG: hypothetical protein JHC95_15430 [Solirubrobacteraceae bacterium]|nr:hypothetical protein [Solirubrobacteraceae bacterium]